MILTFDRVLASLALCLNTNYNLVVYGSHIFLYDILYDKHIKMGLNTHVYMYVVVHMQLQGKVILLFTHSYVVARVFFFFTGTCFFHPKLGWKKFENCRSRKLQLSYRYSSRQVPAPERTMLNFCNLQVEDSWQGGAGRISASCIQWK